MTFIEKQSLSHDAAQQMIKGAVKKAEELGIAVNIAVVDDGGNLITFSRMDGAALLSVDIAKNKAYTSVAFGVPTHEWYDMIKDHDALRTGIVHTDRLVVFGGGYPVFSGETLAGGIGISGGSEEEDMLCAQAGMEAIGK